VAALMSVGAAGGVGAQELVSPPPALSGDALSGPVAGDSEAGRETMRRVAREHERQVELRREFLASPEARAQRRQSQTAFEGLEADEVLALLRREFSTELLPSVPDAETLLGGDRLVSFSSDFVAQIDGVGDRPDRLIESMVPLRPPGGSQVPVDLDIERAGDDFAPGAGLVDLQIGDQLGDGIELGPLHVTLAGEGTARRLDADTLVYPSVAPGVDVAVNTTPTGFETFHQLRSPEASEVQRLDLDLPAGTVLRESAGGGAEVVDGDQVKAVISPPAAVDAQESNVAASYAVVGDDLVVTVDHRSREVAYPVLLDPEFSVRDDWACGWGSTNCTATWFHGHGFALDGLARWEAQANTSATAYGLFKQCSNYSWFNNCYGPSHGGGPNWNLASNSWSHMQTGLHIYVSPNAWYQGGSEFGQWVYKVPRLADDPHNRTTQIYRADFGAKFLRKRSSIRSGNGHPWTYPVMFTAIWDWSRWDYASLVYHDPLEPMPEDYHGGYTHHWNTQFGTSRFGAQSPGPQSAAFGFVNPGGATYVPQYRDAYMGAAIMQLTDPEPPTISEADPTLTENGVSVAPTKWTKDGTFAFAPRVKDPGLGVRRLRLSVPLANSTTATHERGVYCSGASGLACEDDFKLPYPGQDVIRLSAADGDPNTSGNQPIKDGQQTVTMKAVDALGSGTDDNGRGHETTITKTIKVDRTGPSSELSGSLYSLRDRWLDDGSYDLTVTATDPHSGVKSLKVLVDDQEVAIGINALPQDGASLSKQYTLQSQPYSYGHHRVKIVLEDNAGNLSLREWSVFMEPTPEEAIDEVRRVAPGIIAPSRGTVFDETPVDPTLERTTPLTFSASGVLTPTTLPLRLRDDATIQSGPHRFPVKVNDSDGAAFDGRVVDGDSLMYANTGEGTDTIVRPIAHGLESFLQLRGPSAPQQHRLTIGLRAEDRLVQLSPTKIGVFGAPEQLCDGEPCSGDEELECTSSLPGDCPPEEDPCADGTSTLPCADPSPLDCVVDPLLCPPEAEGTCAGTVIPCQTDQLPPCADSVPEPCAESSYVEPCYSSENDEPCYQPATDECSQQGGTESPDHVADARSQVCLGIEELLAASAQPDELLAVVSAPWARDADARSVPTTVSVDGASVVLTVQHNSGFNYPVIADPKVVSSDFQDKCRKVAPDKFCRLNDRELRLCLRGNTRDCFSFAQDEAKAAKLAGHLFVGRESRGDNTQSNAFKHAYWVSLMVNSLSDGERHLAAAFARAHENRMFSSPNVNRRASSRMDMANNYVGYLYGLRTVERNDDEDMCNGILPKVKHGMRVGRRYFIEDFNGYDARRIVWLNVEDLDGTTVRPAKGNGCGPA